jgi:hypothetical protein
MWDAVRNGLQPQPSHHNIIWASPHPNFPKFAPHLHRYNHEWVHSYAHPQHMKVFEHLYTFNMDVGCSKWWFTASTMTPQHIWAPPYPNFSKFDPYLHRYNSVRVHPYAHPQHIMALKHFIYMQIYVHDQFLTQIHSRVFLSARASTGSVTSESKSVTSPVTNANKTPTLGGS